MGQGSGSDDNRYVSNGSWKIDGESIVGLIGDRGWMPSVPKGLCRIPGPGIVICENVTNSPVGPFCSIWIGEPVRKGLRFAFHFSVSVVSTKQARHAGHAYWGFSHQLGTIDWCVANKEVSVVWREQDLKITALRSAFAFPAYVPLKSLQTRSEGIVVVPQSVRGLGRLARLSIDANESKYPRLACKSFGLHIGGMVLNRDAARYPIGMVSSLRLPLRAPEPGVAGMNTSQRAQT